MKLIYFDAESTPDLSGLCTISACGYAKIQYTPKEYKKALEMYKRTWDNVSRVNIDKLQSEDVPEVFCYHDIFLEEGIILEDAVVVNIIKPEKNHPVAYGECYFGGFRGAIL